MEDKVKYTAGDTYPPIRRQILSDATEVPEDLTGATGVFQARTAVGTVVINESMVIETPETDGVVRYDWGATDLENPGKYYAKFKGTLAGGEILSYPTGDDYIEIIVGEAIV